MISIEIYKSIKLKVKCSKSDLLRLNMCNKESAEIWNYCMIKNKTLFDTESKISTLDELEHFAKEYQCSTLCANSKQRVARRLYDAYKAIARARKSGRTDEKYPHKLKQYYPSEWTYQYLKCDYAKNKIYLTTARAKDSNQKMRNGKLITLKFKHPLPSGIKTMRLIYTNNAYYACLTFVHEYTPNVLRSVRAASIDLGETHSIASIDVNSNQIIITGRKLRAIKQLRNKKQAELRKKMAKCQKGSRQYSKYQNAYNYIVGKTQNQIYYHIHKLTRLYTEWALEKGISQVFCGDVTGIEKNAKKNNKGSALTRQKISQWDYGKIMYYLEYKLGMEGIAFKKVNEAYSSQICPDCGVKNKPKGRNYTCGCGANYHRDIVGAYNILRFNTTVNLPPHHKTKYLRIV